MGIIAGDGYLYNSNKIHQLEIYLNLSEDVFYLNHVKKLIKNLFNIDPKIRTRKDKGTFDITINSKAIAFFIEGLEFPNGKKNRKLKIPIWIMKNKPFIIAYLRGIIDTDGSLFFAKRGTYKKNSYPVIEIKILDKKFIKEIYLVFKKLGFVCNSSKFKIQLNGQKNLQKWIAIINTDNFAITSRYILWRMLKYCPPKTNLQERITMIYARVAESGNAHQKWVESPAEREIVGPNPTPSSFFTKSK